MCVCVPVTAEQYFSSGRDPSQWFPHVPFHQHASLALQDFRGAVSGASRQNGKPVIEERLLNQILYYLPQLYELNQDLLRELKQRVAKW